MAWNAVEKPYVVTWWAKTGIRYSDWKTKIESFATEAEARVAFEASMKAPYTKVDITYAENAATWNRNGYWRTVAKRGRRKPTNA